MKTFSLFSDILGPIEGPVYFGCFWVKQPSEKRHKVAYKERLMLVKNDNIQSVVFHHMFLWNSIRLEYVFHKLEVDFLGLVYSYATYNAIFNSTLNLIFCEGEGFSQR